MIGNLLLKQFQVKLVARMIEDGWDPTFRDRRGLNATDYAIRFCPTRLSMHEVGMPPHCQEVKDMLDAL